MSDGTALARWLCLLVIMMCSIWTLRTILDIRTDLHKIVVRMEPPHANH